MQPPSPEAAKSRWAVAQWWIAHPLVSFIGMVLSIVLAIYFGVSSKQTRELVIASDPAVAVVKAGQASSIDVIYHGQKITTDVYARQIYFWNVGTESIRTENVLEPIGIVIPHGKILETRVKKVSRPLTGITTAISSSDEVGVSWKILEHNDGAAIEIIYASPDASRVEAVGTVEHQRRLKVQESEVTMNDHNETSKMRLLVIGGMFCVMFLVMIIRNIRAMFLRSHRRSVDFDDVVQTVLLLGLLGLFVVGLVNFYYVFIVPPVV